MLIRDNEMTQRDLHNSSTPECVLSLVCRLMKIQESDQVADFGSGTGSFFLKAFEFERGAEYSGFDPIYEDNKNLLADVKGKMPKGIHAIFSSDSMFKLEKNLKFDKIFSHYPFGQTIRHLSDEENSSYKKLLNMEQEKIERTSSADWVYNAVLLSHLKEEGKAFAIMTNGGTFNATDSAIRKTFVENGWIEAVISLPDYLFYHTSIPTTLIVLSRNNTQVKMVDASAFCERSRRFNVISEEHIETIIDLIENGGDQAVCIPIDKLTKDYSLDPKRYLLQRSIKVDGDPLASFIRENGCQSGIVRGLSIKAEDLDRVHSEETTGYVYVSLGAIRDGGIELNLAGLRDPHFTEKHEELKGIDFSSFLQAAGKELNEKSNLVYLNPDRFIDAGFFLKKDENAFAEFGDILISKNAPFRVGILTEEDFGNERPKIIANGNTYIVRVDPNMIDPYYLLAFLASSEAEKQMRSVSVGAVLPTLSVGALKNLRIPRKSKEEERMIGQKYRETQDSLRVTYFCLAAAQHEMEAIFN